MVLLTETLTGMSYPKKACLDSSYYQKSLRNWDWLSKLTKAHWRKGWVPWLIMWFVAGKELRLTSWNMARRKLKISWDPQGLKGSRYHRESCVAAVWPCFCAAKGWLRLILKVPCVSSSKTHLKILCDQFLLLLCLCKWTCKNKNWT